MTNTGYRTAGVIPRWWLIYAFIVSLFAVVALGLGVNGIYVDKSQNRADAAANKARDLETARLLECFDQYAAASSSSTTKVRAATVVVDAATTERDRALDAVFKYIATDPPEDDPRGVDLFLALLAANADLVTAQADLDQVRKDNPVPKPPATFCASDDVDEEPSPSSSPDPA